LGMLKATTFAVRTRGANNWEERVRMMSWWVDYLDQLRVVGQALPIKLSRVGPSVIFLGGFCFAHGSLSIARYHVFDITGSGSDTSQLK